MVVAYSVDVRCSNCKKTCYVTEIPKGTTVKEHCQSKKIVCNFCEVELFPQKEEAE